MSTRSIIARIGDHEGTFAGRYCHSDGYPSWMGPHLLTMLRDRFHGDIEAMMVELVDNHPAGWSVAGEICYCHPSGHLGDREPETENDLRTEKDMEDTDVRWLWVFDAENKRLYIRDVRNGEDAGMVDLSAAPPTEAEWSGIECGKNLERCGHYASYHGLVPEGSRMGAQTWLGKRPFELRDAVAFIVNGKRYTNTGCGGDADYLNRTSLRSKALFPYRAFPPRTWVQTVKAGNGRTLDIPVAARTEDGEKPLPGVTWIMPPIKDNPQETLITAQ